MLQYRRSATGLYDNWVALSRSGSCEELVEVSGQRLFTTGLELGVQLFNGSLNHLLLLPREGVRRQAGVSPVLPLELPCKQCRRLVLGSRWNCPVNSIGGYSTAAISDGLAILRTDD